MNRAPVHTCSRSIIIIIKVVLSTSAGGHHSGYVRDTRLSLWISLSPVAGSPAVSSSLFNADSDTRRPCCHLCPLPDAQGSPVLRLHSGPSPKDMCTSPETAAGHEPTSQASTVWCLFACLSRAGARTDEGESHWTCSRLSPRSQCT